MNVEYLMLGIIIGVSLLLGISVILELILTGNFRFEFKKKIEPIEKPITDYKMAAIPQEIESDKYDIIPFNDEPEEYEDLANLNVTEITIKQVNVFKIGEK
jgi:hypothetical protein